MAQSADAGASSVSVCSAIPIARRRWAVRSPSRAQAWAIVVLFRALMSSGRRARACSYGSTALSGSLACIQLSPSSLSRRKASAIGSFLSSWISRSASSWFLRAISAIARCSLSPRSRRILACSMSSGGHSSFVGSTRDFLFSSIRLRIRSSIAARSSFVAWSRRIASVSCLTPATSFRTSRISPIRSRTVTVPSKPAARNAAVTWAAAAAGSSVVTSVHTNGRCSPSAISFSMAAF